MLEASIIKLEIIPHLSVGKVGKKKELDLVEIVQCIFHRLKTGCQWRMLPLKQYVTRKNTSWNAIYYHFNKWCKDGSWEKVWEVVLEKYKWLLDMSCINLDGSSTKAQCGGEEVGYNGRKHYNGTNLLFITDNQGIIISCSSPISGQHHDLFEIDTYFDQMQERLSKSKIDLRYMFMNGDPGFDSKGFRLKLSACDIEGNIKFNKKNGTISDREEYFDEKLYKRRAICEHPFAWMDAMKGLLTRYEKLSSTWLSMNLMGMLHILMRKYDNHITQNA